MGLCGLFILINSVIIMTRWGREVIFLWVFSAPWMLRKNPRKACSCENTFPPLLVQFLKSGHVLNPYEEKNFILSPLEDFCKEVNHWSCSASGGKGTLLMLCHVLFFLFFYFLFITLWSKQPRVKYGFECLQLSLELKWREPLHF